MSDREVSEVRARALLREAAITGAEKRSAMVTLADRALIAADGDREAAREVLREALEIAGFLPYRSVPLKARGTQTLTVNYQRPGAPS